MSDRPLEDKLSIADGEYFFVRNGKQGSHILLVGFVLWNGIY